MSTLINPIDLLIQQFRDKPIIGARLTIFNAMLQEIADTLVGIGSLKSIDDAVGMQLDNIGGVLGVIRNGLSDSDFRVVLSVQILLNHSCGEPSSLIRAARMLTNPAKVLYSEYYPAHVVIGLSIPQSIPSNMMQVLQSVKAGGVGLTVVSAVDDADVFRFDIGKGFSELYGVGYYYGNLNLSGSGGSGTAADPWTKDNWIDNVPDGGKIRLMGSATYAANITSTKHISVGFWYGNGPWRINTIHDINMGNTGFYGGIMVAGSLVCDYITDCWANLGYLLCQSTTVAMNRSTINMISAITSGVIQLNCSPSTDCIYGNNTIYYNACTNPIIGANNLSFGNISTDRVDFASLVMGTGNTDGGGNSYSAIGGWDSAPNIPSWDNADVTVFTQGHPFASPLWSHTNDFHGLEPVPPADPTGYQYTGGLLVELLH